MAERGSDRRNNRGGRGAGAGQGSARRDQRAADAAKHIDEMERRFAKEIEAAAAATQVIDGMPEKPAAAAEPAAAETVTAAEAAAGGEAAEAGLAVPAEDGAPAEDAADAAEAAAPAAPTLPAVTVVDQDAVAAILERGRGRAQYTDLAVLDFASFTSPGGGYDRGAWAQEEALCAESFLFNVLNRNKGWYAENRRRNMNCNLYRNRGLVVPRVRFARDRVHAYADVIVVAAPNAKFAKSEYGVSDEALEAAMRDRIRFALRIAESLGHGRVILGAFGCGAFGWDAAVVAPMFLEELSSGAYDLQEVVFAIPKARYNENLERFQHVFARFPEANDAPYGVVEEVAPAPAEDAEDEDDWRKYLG